ERQRLGRALSRRDQHIDEKPALQRTGDEVEEDGGDDDVAAALRLQPGRDERPERAAQHRRENGEGQRHGERRGAEGEAEKGHGEAAEHLLACAADIEEAGMEGEGDGKAGEDEGGGVIEGEADAFRIAEGAVDKDGERRHGIGADGEDDKPRQQQRRDEVQERQQDVIGPARQLSRRSHATSSRMPAIPRPSSPQPAFPGSVATTPQPAMTRIRSATAPISSSSTETRRIAVSASRSARRRRWMNSMAPISTPRVGWPTRRRRGCRSISRAQTSFCWLPPEK